MEWNALKDCGELVLPGDNRFERVRAKPFIARDAEPVPAAVLRVGCVHGAAGAVPDPAAHRWVRRQWATAHPYGTGGVYANFQDTDVDWPTAYYGPNLDRLRQVKHQYDPDNLFGAGI